MYIPEIRIDNIDDVNEHLGRMTVLRRKADAHGDKRKYVGAVASIVIDEQVPVYALKSIVSM
jgi:hypothetical protein